MQDAALILVSGPPGAGKTTLAQHIAAEFGLPLFEKDAIKERLADVLGWQDIALTRQLGEASIRLLFYVIEQQLAAGQSIIAESTFVADYDAPQLRELQDRHRFRLLEFYCTAPSDLLFDRMLARAASRHPCHHELSRTVELRARLQAGAWQPISPPDYTVRLDTSDFKQLDYGYISDKVKRLLADV